MSARRLREALAAPPWQPDPASRVPVTPRKAAANEHEYLRRFVDPVLMPLIESLLLYQPESVYEFIHDYVDEAKSTRFSSSQSQAPGYAKKLASRRKMVDFMATSVIPVMDDLAHQILLEKPSSVPNFIKDVVAARIIVGCSSSPPSNQQEAIELHVNDRVQCRYKGRPRFYPGVITAIHPEDDSFTVLYTDGRTELHVHRMCLKPDEVLVSDNQADKPAETPVASKQRSIEIVTLIIGIDGAGKTTLLSTLQGDLDKEHVPSAGFTSATFQTETGSATFYDLGGGPAFRNVWTEYYADAHAVMFVVDSSSENVVLQSAAILQDSMAHSLMTNKPLLVFANKRDHPSALAESELISLLQLDKFPSSHLVLCVAKPAAFEGQVDERLETGLQWLFDQVNSDYESLHGRVQADLAVKKAQDQQRRADQRARVSAWREEREQREMVAHDKPSLLAETRTSTTNSSVDDEPQSQAQKKNEQPEEAAVILCSNCATQPAVTKCAASKWMPVCAVCAVELKSSRNQ